MRYRTFGKTQEKVSTLGFGCMRLPLIGKGDPSRIDEEKAVPLIRGAIDRGVNYLDTAYPYHGRGFTQPGESEPFVGRVLQDGYRDNVKLATKLPTWLLNKPEDMDQYLNEQLVGVQLGTQLLRRRLDDPGLNPVERDFVERLKPAFTELVGHNEQRLFVGGAAGLLDDVRSDEVTAYRGLLELLERRRALLDVLAESLDPRRRPFVRVGVDISNPALHELALVGAAYGISNRTLGAVSLVGPTRMDYEKAIRSVRAAASELSRFSEDLFGDN